ncbi:SA1362 family protein [Terribacillus saccharophilus]|uniref:SA1362 family protein n=1 Tax=Terribacillus saccharophilus TaxID=361277 RepID=UPI002DCE50EF|nr:SA1362 family protein [Terribacillus saccharophilus]
MRRSGSSIIVFVLIGLAVIGVSMQLVTNPGAFFQNVLVWIGGAVLFGALLYFILTRLRGRTAGAGGGSNGDMQKYKKAVKQSKQKYKQPKSRPVNKPAKQAANIKKASAARKKRTVKDRSRGPQLRVIEGNKQKRKKSSI